jgi:hypothetical protein
LYLLEIRVGRGCNGVHCSADIVEDRKNAWRSLPFDQIANDLIVEVIDVLPFNSFLDIFLLKEIKWSLV